VGVSVREGRVGGKVIKRVGVYWVSASDWGRGTYTWSATTIANVTDSRHSGVVVILALTGPFGFDVCSSFPKWSSGIAPYIEAGTRGMVF
jgi:hypothetical protein